ncbi:MAG: DUF1206 domain-containing protein [Acidimicrobiales bacterium]
MHSGVGRAEDVKDSAPGGALARSGLAARGFVYLVLGYLIADIVVSGAAGKSANSRGAFGELLRQPAGPGLMVVLSIGFAAYAAWRLLQAAGRQHLGSQTENAVRRLSYAGIGAVYLFLCAEAVLFLAGSSSKSYSAFSVSRLLLGVPGGRVVLVLIGAGFAGGGIGLGVSSLVRSSRRYPFARRTPAPVRRVATVLAVFGDLARGFAFAGIGASFFAAALAGSAQQAKGLNGMVQTVASHPYGQVVLPILAAGFLAFGVASVAQAAYGDLDAGRSA